MELARRGDVVTMSRFVDFVADDAVRGVVEAIEDEAALLRVAFYMGSKNRMDHFFGMLPPKRLEALILRGSAASWKSWTSRPLQFRPSNRP